jgi:cellulose biosynthesis protein BcsQ
VEAYNFDKEYEPPEWYVDGLIPSKTLTFLLSKAGVGKSFLAEYLAVCSVYGHTFLGRKIKPHNVLLIDQDTPQDVLDRRLLEFSKYMKEKNLEPKRRLYVELMRGYSLSNGSLIKRIERSNVKVVIIDSLNSVAGNFDVNSTKDMAVLSRLKNAVVGKGKTLILIHHISEHAVVSVDEIMTTNDTNRLTMGNSIINQQADTLFFLASKHKSSLINLYVRPVPKRVSLAVKPFIAQLIENDEGSHFVMRGFYEDRKYSMVEADKDIIQLFTKDPKKRGTYAVYYDMKSKHTMYAVRKSLGKLAKCGILKENKENPKLFTYEIKNKKE